MRRLEQIFLAPLFVIYGLLFLTQEHLFKEKNASLQLIPSAAVLRVTTGYLQQLTAEILFVQSAVFLGGLKPGTDPHSYAATLAHNYQQITSLYPQFNDPYYYAQSYLANISPEVTQVTNEILETGRKTYPDNLVYPFFQGFNCFRYLDQPLKGADIFREASRLPDAPPMFSHLAVILAAQGGQLQAGILTLHAMLKSTDDVTVKKRYQDEIDMFRLAFKVQKAADAFYEVRKQYPVSLNELVPDFLSELPSFGTAFELTWHAPVVALKRPHAP